MKRDWLILLTWNHGKTNCVYHTEICSFSIFISQQRRPGKVHIHTETQREEVSEKENKEEDIAKLLINTTVCNHLPVNVSSRK